VKLARSPYTNNHSKSIQFQSFERPVNPAFLLRVHYHSPESPVDNYCEYLRTFSQELGARIVEMYPPLQGSKDPLPPVLKTLLRQLLPAHALTISGVSKHLKTARSAIIVGECGTGKTLMSVAVAHAVAHTHSEGRPYTTIGMCPPHLVFKWAREVLETIPRARTFIIYDLRNGGDPTRPHGVVEVRQRNGQIAHKGLKTTLFELRVASHESASEPDQLSLHTLRQASRRSWRIGQ
jgi:hypothetical protein